MDRRILIWLIILVALMAALGFLLTGNNTTTATTTTLGEATTTTQLKTTTTRITTRPTQPTTTLIGVTTLPTTTTLSGTTSTTISTSSNATTASTTTTTHPDTPDATTTTSTTIAGATTTTTQAGATTTTQQGTTTTTQAGATTTTVLSTTTTTAAAATTSTTTATSTTSTTSTTLAQQSAPALYLKFDETAGTTAYDSSSGGNDAELINGPTWTSGKTGNALRLDGTNDYAYISTTSSLDIYNSITIMAWIKPTTVTKTQDIVCRHWQTSYTGYELRLSPTGELMFRINPTASSYTYRTSSGAAIAANVWQHIAVTYDGTNIRFYKNGALVSTVAAGGKLYSGTSDVFIGVYESETEDFFSGLIDELRIYDKTLSAAEINQIYSTASDAATTTTLQGTTTTNPTTTSSTTRITTTIATTTTTSTTFAPSCKAGGGYAFSSLGTYTANSASGVASISRSGQYTFYETPHNYANNLNCPWSGTYTCPAGTNIRFYLRAQTESGYDYFNIRNSAGTTYEQIDGDYGTSYTWTSTYNQRTAAFNFISDGGVVNWGIDLYQIGCVTPTTTTTTTTTRVTTPTTTPPGGDCYGAEDCNPTGDPIGGGAGYSDIITSGDYTATTESQLRSALASASSGDVVFIPNGVTIDISGKEAFVVPGGVTLASNRGSGGATGALIIKNEPSGSGVSSWAWGDPAILCDGDNVRITGLQIEGEMFPSTDTPVVPESEYLTGILQRGPTGLEVDNCELRGFAWASVFIYGGTGNIHHNYIHYSLARSEGYGVEAAGSYTLIEANIFDNNRHSIAWGAGTQGGYEARYNIHLGHGTGIGFSHFDIHEGDTGGGIFRIHHNTFEMSQEWNIGIQGPFGGTAYIDHNIFNSVGGCDSTVFSYAPPSEISVTKNYCGSTYYPDDSFVMY